jgi:hypothetical protein
MQPGVPHGDRHLRTDITPNSICPRNNNQAFGREFIPKGRRAARKDDGHFDVNTNINFPSSI